MTDYQKFPRLILMKNGEIWLNRFLCGLSYGMERMFMKNFTIKTQLNRKDINIAGLKKLFANPRQHTGKGYY